MHALIAAHHQAFLSRGAEAIKYRGHVWQHVWWAGAHACKRLCIVVRCHRPIGFVVGVSRAGMVGQCRVVDGISRLLKKTLDARWGAKLRLWVLVKVAA